MDRAPINEEFLPGNTCVGCGLTNPDGLQIRVYRDPSRELGLLGEWDPRATQTGFPQIVHGGMQYTALDCMAAWTLLVRRLGRVVPLTTTASMRYRRPVRVGSTVALRSSIVSDPKAPSPKDPFVIATELRDQAGEVLSDAEFQYVVLPEDRFLKAVGLGEMPDCYRHHFGDVSAP